MRAEVRHTLLLRVSRPHGFMMPTVLSQGKDVYASTTFAFTSVQEAPITPAFITALTTTILPHERRGRET
jgi:hypothetical protein